MSDTYTLNARQSKHWANLNATVREAELLRGAALAARQAFLLALQDTLDLDDTKDWTATQSGDTLTFTAPVVEPPPEASPSPPTVPSDPPAASEVGP